MAGLYAFTKNWQKRGLKEGALGVAVIGLFFTIGWALTGAIARIIYPSAWNSVYFSSDTLSLALLLVPEIYFFYHFFYKDRVTRA